MMQSVENTAIATFPVAEASHIRSIKWSILGRDRSLPHFGRKFYHFLMGMVCFSLYAFLLNREEAILTLVTLGGSLVVVDILRLRYAPVNQVALKYFGKLMRREELKSISGNSFFVVGLITITFFFPKPIVLLSVLYLAIGDPIAAVFGSLYGKTKIIGKKSLEGSAANFIATTFATFLFVTLYLKFRFPMSILLALSGGMISVVSELFPAPVDDNFSIPVLSSIFLSVLFGFLSIA